MRFSDDFIEKVREANNIVDIVSPYVAFKRSGSNMFGLCPFPNHREKTASFSINDSKQIYFCFGCKKGGNVIKFLEEYHGMSFPEAIEHLANRAGIPIPQDTSRAPSSESDLRPIYYKINSQTADFYHKLFLNLPETHVAKVYAKKRGLTAQMIEEFKIGYSHDDWSQLCKFHEQQKNSIKFLEKLGLVKARSGAGQQGHYDIFRGRLMFPIVNTMEQVVGFGGRVLEQGEPKYLNSPETPVFHKGRVFYGLNQSAKHIRNEDLVIVVEGYMDFLGLYQVGVQNVVATLGTALTENHASIVKRYTKNVLVLFDGDQAGQGAAMRSLPILLEAGLFPRGLTLPDNLDPDEFVAKFGAEELKKLCKEAKDLFFIFLDKIFAGYKPSPAEKVKMMDQVQPVLSKVSDLRLRDLYLREVSERMQENFNWVKQQMTANSAPTRKNIPQEGIKKSVEEMPSKIEAKDVASDEKLLLQFALAKREYLDKILSENLREQITSRGVQQIFQIMVDTYLQDPNNFDKLTALLASRVEDTSLVTQPVNSNFADTEEDEQKLFQNCVRKIKDKNLRMREQQLLRELKVQEDPQKLEELMRIVKDRHSLQ